MGDITHPTRDMAYACEVTVREVGEDLGRNLEREVVEDGHGGCGRRRKRKVGKESIAIYGRRWLGVTRCTAAEMTGIR